MATKKGRNFSFLKNKLHLKNCSKEPLNILKQKPSSKSCPSKSWCRNLLQILAPQNLGAEPFFKILVQNACIHSTQVAGWIVYLEKCFRPGNNAVIAVDGDG